MKEDLSNQFGVGVRKDDIIVVHTPKQIMTKHEALVFAAWLVLLADDDDAFDEIKLKVGNL